MMYVADANIFATTNIIPTDPPNSGPRALLIMTTHYIKELTSIIKHHTTIARIQ